MSLTKENSEKNGRILLIFSENASLRKLLPDSAEEKCRLTLTFEDSGFLEDVVIELLFWDGYWHIKERPLSDKAPFYYYTEGNKKLLLLLSAVMVLRPADKISLQNEDEINIGSAFRNQIFFECYSLVGDVHVKIRHEEKGFVIENPGLTGVYLNERILRGKKFLCSGDRVDIYGLHLFVLGDMLICTAFCGICRITGKGRYGNLPGCHIKLRKTGEKKWIERGHGCDEALHMGEVEVLLPELPTVSQKQPLFLGLGPTVTMVVPMLFTAWMMNNFMEGTGGGFYYLSALMSGCSALIALFWGILGRGYQRYSDRQKKQEKEGQYREYLNGIREELSFYQSENSRILKQRYPSLDFFCEKEQKKPVVLWNRYYRQEDFLFFRLGTGNLPFQVKVKLSGRSKGIVQKNLIGEAEKLKEDFAVLKGIPAGVDFYESRQIGIWGDFSSNGIFEIISALCMQIAACQCYTEVKVACFYHKDRIQDRQAADCIRWMSHSWSLDKKTRFLAGDEQEAEEILPVLTREITRGSESVENTGKTSIGTAVKAGFQIPWHIVLVLHEELIWGEPLYRYLTQPDGIYPVSAVFVEKEREQLPKSCRLFLAKTGNKGEILSLEKNIKRQEITLESCDVWKIQKYIRQISGFQVREVREDGQLPEKVDFMRLYGCEKVKELESGRRWKMAKAGQRLKVPIGIGVGGRLVSLDIHEKFHGPHGLIAGTTGSGKSELLQTYLLSMAVNFSPEDVSFFMIDYKGGGTGNLLKSLPHCAGVISNLSGKQIRRAMSAIASENRRRQLLLSNFQVNHIDAYTGLYREGKADQAMPHLLLVVDEFAELKREEPEFMQEIISLAQVGRSLGVHLILATQKPAGTVDDKIWSNARFRLCLRVQDRQDSLDMLHSGEAASLTRPGQCYLQIGNHEYFELFQAAYCGGICRESKEKKVKAALLSNTGKRMKRKDEPDRCNCKSQLEVLIDYIQETAKTDGYLPAPTLWLPELPEQIFLKELKAAEQKSRPEESEKGEKHMLLGLCDDPENQCNFILSYQPAVQGHLAVCGGPASGKTAFLQTILWQIGMEFTPAEAIFLIVDVRQEGTAGFGCMPHCVGVLKEKENKDVFVYHLEKMVNKRRKILSGISYEQYNKARKGQLPRIYLVIDNYGALKDLLDENQEEFMRKLASEGISLGFLMIISASGIGDITGRIYEKIRTVFALEMSDKFQYGDVLRQYYIPVLPKENQKGRGLCRQKERVLEFQTALFAKEQTGCECMEIIEQAGRKRGELLKKEGAPVPEKFPEIPAEPYFAQLARDFDWAGGKIPLGYCLATGEICSMTPEKSHCFLISGNEGTGKRNLLCCLIEGALYLDNLVVVLDYEKRFQNFKGRRGIVYLEGEKETENWRTEQEEEYEKAEYGGGGRAVSVVIGDMGSFCNFIYRSDEGRKERAAFWEKAAGGSGEIGFLAGIYHNGKDWETAGCEFFREFTAWRQGVHLGGNAAAQRVLSFDDLSYTRQNQPEPPGIGYFKEKAGSATRRLLLPLHEKGEEK